jgi:histidinol phosphatase-like PHP family hydrolase
MKLNNICVADLHLHTNLSACAPSDTTLKSYLPYCAQEGIKKIGISNHLYTDKGIEHTLKIKNEIQEIQKDLPIQVLVGGEMELYYGREPMLQKSNAKEFDYVLVAPSHIFNQIHMYENFDLSTTDKIRHLLIENFKSACQLELGVPTGICHPLYPICAPNQQEILDGITDKQLSDCFCLAAQNNKSIEIHACLYRDTVTLDAEGLSPSYIRILSIAKECGCKFHFGTDAHRPEEFIHRHSLLERAAMRANIREENLWDLARI